MAVPQLLASGRTADVFAVGPDRVLRRYRDGGDVAAEAALMAHVAGHGFPVPTVLRAAGAELEMARVDGPTLLEATLLGRVGTGDAAALLVTLLDRLHTVPPPPGSPGAAVVHLDFHPANILLGPDGPVVIDWTNARTDAPELDLAMTSVILAQVAVGTFAEYAAVAPAARELLVAVLGRARPGRPIPGAAAGSGDPLRLLERAAAMRAADPSLTAAERAAVADAVELVRAASDGIST